jgi:hypothetical protein
MNLFRSESCSARLLVRRLALSCAVFMSGVLPALAQTPAAPPPPNAPAAAADQLKDISALIGKGKYDEALVELNKLAAETP